MRRLWNVWAVVLLAVFSVHGDELDWASSPYSPFAVKSSEYVEILKPENNAILNNQSAFIELKAEFSAGEHKELCVSLVNTKLDEVEASQCFVDDKIQNVIFDHLELGGEYQIKVSLHEHTGDSASPTKQLAITLRAFKVGSVFGRSIDGALEEALSEHTNGKGEARFDNVRKLYAEILRVQPKHADAMHLLGALYLQSIPEQMRDAEALVQSAIRLMPNNANYVNTLGQIQEQLGDMDAAIETYKASIELSQTFITPYLNIMMAYYRNGEYAKSDALVRNIIDNQTLMYTNRNVDESRRLFSMHCESFRLQGKNRKSENCFNDALEIWPESGEMWNLLGNVQLAMQDYTNAISSYEKAVHLGYEEAIANSALMLDHEGHAVAAEKQYRHALAILKNRGGDLLNGIRIKIALILPRILVSMAEINKYRSRMEDEIDQLIDLPQSEIFVNDMLSQGMSTGFFLSYHGPPSLILRAKIAHMYRHVTNHRSYLTFGAARPESRNLIKLHTPAANDGKIRIGFVSRFFYRHSIGKLMQGLIQHLRRDVFEVYVYAILPKRDPISEGIRSVADHYEELAYDVSQAVGIISSHNIDVLVYPEIGMDPLAYLLANRRLARVQSVWWGHPETSGIPEIDYFVSLSVEVPGASTHYTEKMYALSGIGTYYNDPAAAMSYSQLNHTYAKLKLISEIIGLGSSEEEKLHSLRHTHIYTCPQSLFKLHPDHFDVAVKYILDHDPQAHVVLVRGRQNFWTETLLKRLASKLLNGAESNSPINRVHFIKRRNHAGFLNMLLGSDVVLDTYPFGGGVSNLEAFAVGTPVISQPDKYLRGRLTLAFYRTMGLQSQFVRYSIEEYASLAIRTAIRQDDHLRRLVYERKTKIFSNANAIKEWERFFVFVCQSRNLKRGGVSLRKYLDKPQRSF
eukprot:g1566.t1